LTARASRGHRVAAVAALAGALAAPAAAVVAALGHLVVLVLAGIGAAVAVGTGWIALTRRGRRSVVAAGVALAGIALVAVALLAACAAGLALVGLLVVVALVAVTLLLTRVALGGGRPAPAATASRVPPGTRSVLLLNPQSGGGKVEQFDLPAECRRRRIEPIELGPDDDVRAAALAAVREGADVLGAAGGDGTQACVAAVAAEHDLPYVCIAAGTRNHFAFDLGVDRDDVLAGLDAFVDPVERRVDLGVVNDRVFVNNVSLGVYGEIVQADEYRDAKVRTAIERLPDLLGPDGDAPELRCTGPDGRPRATRQLILVSNNPYELERMSGFGTRERLDTGVLGITLLTVDSAAQAAALTALGLAGQVARFEGYEAWTASELQVDADRSVAAGIDGEFCDLEPPVRCAMRPGALRVRLARHAPGAAPATVARPDRATLTALLRVARGVAPAA
jgi:diacylglycerol kinase family enzyme